MDKMTFKALFDHSSIGIIISSENGIIEQSNAYASKIFGYGLGELNGQMVEVLLPPSLREKHVDYRAQYNQHPIPRSMGTNLNLYAIRKNGEEFPVEVSLTFFEALGRRQIVSFINDVSVRKKAENELRRLTEELESKVRERTKELSDALMELNHMNEGLQLEMEQRKRVEAQIREMLEKEKELNELKSRFVSMASHEFRTPLAGIMTSISLIGRYTNQEDQPKRERHIQTIKNSVRNLTSILNDFLSLDKLEQGKVTSNPIQFDFVTFLDELADEFRETSQKNQSIVLDHQQASLSIYLDKEMLRNLLVNLISNAVKYSPEESTITLSSGVKENRLVISIKDQGMGIPETDQRHLFERFFRATNVINLQGTGLGLNIVKRYLELMNGIISFESKENSGTTFTVSLPLESK
jgi:PAS domain S-box-containing protein